MSMRCLVMICAILCAGSVSASAQVLYLSPYTGDGSDAAPFRAYGVGHGAECKSLRPDETQAAGYALCTGPVMPVEPGVIDLTGKAILTKADRDAILADRGLAVSANTVHDLLGELVDTQNVILKRKNGRERIIIKGQDVWSRPAPIRSYLRDLPQMIASWFAPALGWAASTVTETFTCADDSDGDYSCDHTWSRVSGNYWRIAGNKLRFDDGLNAAQRMRQTSTAMDTTDMLVRAKVTTLTIGSGTGVSAGPLARVPNSTTATYVFCYLVNASSDEAQFGHVVSGAVTTDGTQAITYADGDTVEVRAFDDQLSCLHNNTLVLGPITESTGDGNLYFGARTFGSGTDGGQVMELDDFFASNSLPSSSHRRGVVILP